MYRHRPYNTGARHHGLDRTMYRYENRRQRRVETALAMHEFWQERVERAEEIKADAELQRTLDALEEKYAREFRPIKVRQPKTLDYSYHYSDLRGPLTCHAATPVTR